MEGDSLISKGFCQAQLIPTGQARRGKEQGGIQRSSGKRCQPEESSSLCSSTLCCVQAPSQRHIHCSHIHRLQGDSRDLSTGRSSRRVKKQRQDKEGGADVLPVQQAECEQCQHARSIPIRADLPLSQSAALAPSRIMGSAHWRAGSSRHWRDESSPVGLKTSILHPHSRWNAQLSAGLKWDPEPWSGWGTPAGTGKVLMTHQGVRSFSGFKVSADSEVRHQK